MNASGDESAETIVVQKVTFTRTGAKGSQIAALRRAVLSALHMETWSGEVV